MNCLCGEPIDIEKNYLWSFGKNQIVIGCQACGYTGEKSKRKQVGAIVVRTASTTSNDNGEANGS